MNIMKDDDKLALESLLASIKAYNASKVELQHFFAVKSRTSLKPLTSELEKMGYETALLQQGLFRPPAVVATHVVPALDIADSLGKEIAICESLAKRVDAVHDGWEGGPVLPAETYQQERVPPHD
jgi:hypothetical protein